MMKIYKWLFLLAIAGASSANAEETGLYYKIQHDSGVGDREVFYTDVQKRFNAIPDSDITNDELSSVYFLMVPTPDFSSIFQFYTSITFTAPGERRWQ